VSCHQWCHLLPNIWRQQNKVYHSHKSNYHIKNLWSFITTPSMYLYGVIIGARTTTFCHYRWPYSGHTASLLWVTFRRNVTNALSVASVSSVTMTSLDHTMRCCDPPRVALMDNARRKRLEFKLRLARCPKGTCNL
jgi:hypothetical protein